MKPPLPEPLATYMLVPTKGAGRADGADIQRRVIKVKESGKLPKKIIRRLRHRQFVG